MPFQCFFSKPRLSKSRKTTIWDMYHFRILFEVEPSLNVGKVPHRKWHISGFCSSCDFVKRTGKLPHWICAISMFSVLHTRREKLEKYHHFDGTFPVLHFREIASLEMCHFRICYPWPWLPKSWKSTTSDM